MPHASQLTLQDISHMRAIQAAFSEAESHLHILKQSKISLELVQDSADSEGMVRLTEPEVRKLNGLVRALSQSSDALESTLHTFQELMSLDDLTRLYSRKHVLHLLEKEIDRARRYDAPFSLLSLHIHPDVDFTLSTLDQQLMLAEVGRVITNRVRQADAPARMGDDTFLMMLPETPPAGAEILAKRLMDDIRGITLDMDAGECTLEPSMALMAINHKTEATLGDVLLALDGLLQQAQQTESRFVQG